MERTKKEINIKKLLNRVLSYIILFIGIFSLCYSIKSIVEFIEVKKENVELQEILSDLKQSNDYLGNLNTKLKDKNYFSIYVKDKYQYSSNNNSITPLD